MSSYPAYDFGVPALLAVWIAIGAVCSAWIHWRLQRWPGLGRVIVLWTLGPISLAVVGVLELWAYLLRGGTWAAGSGTKDPRP